MVIISVLCSPQCPNKKGITPADNSSGKTLFGLSTNENIASALCIWASVEFFIFNFLGIQCHVYPNIMNLIFTLSHVVLYSLRAVLCHILSVSFQDLPRLIFPPYESETRQVRWHAMTQCHILGKIRKLQRFKTFRKCKILHTYNCRNSLGKQISL